MRKDDQPPGIVPIGTAPSVALLQLNQADADRLSSLDGPGLAKLSAMAFMAVRIGEAEAMLIAFDQDAAYDSPNFLWFKQRFPRFVYVDRVVVARERRGQGHARALYEALFASARMAGQARVVCEVNAQPPNPGSDAFHRKLGFQPVGSGAPFAGKRVSYLSRELPIEGDTEA